MNRITIIELMCMKRMIYTAGFLSVFVLVALMLAACDKDEWKDEVDALKQPQYNTTFALQVGVKYCF